MSGPGPDDEPPPAARRKDLGVEVTRELGGGGRLARGGGTRYSTLKFSSRGVPHGGEAEAPARAVPDGARHAPESAPLEPPMSKADDVVAPESRPAGVLGRMAEWLGLRGA